MNKLRFTFLMLASIICGAQAFATIAYELTMSQTIVGGNLHISMYIRSTGTSSFEIGSADFRVNVNSEGLNLTALPTEIAEGLWDDNNDPMNYSDQSPDRSAADGWVSIHIPWHSPPNPFPVPTSATLIGTIAVPITNAALNSNATWRTTGTSACTVSDRYASSITAYATWTNPEVFALPVELTFFTAFPIRLTAQLAWSTATEKNNYGFDVERRTMRNDDSEWVKAGFVSGAGTSNAPKDYSYSDATVCSGKYIYRLKQIDHDGTFKYSQSVEVNIEFPEQMTLNQNYPNPFNPTTIIEFTIPSNGLATLKVFNVLGEEVATIFNGVAEAGKYHQMQFNASNLSSGIYFSRLQCGDQVQLKKLMLLR